MKTQLPAKTAFILFSICLYLIPASVCSGLGKSEEIPADEKTPYKVPAEKAQKWEALKNVALKDYDVCLEHCGYEQACLDRCETVYKSRLDREYNLLLNEKETGPDK
jgi:hypothetical protein